MFRPGSPVFTGKSGFGIVGIGYGMARGGGKIGYEPGRLRGGRNGDNGFRGASKEIGAAFEWEARRALLLVEALGVALLRSLGCVA